MISVSYTIRMGENKGKKKKKDFQKWSKVSHCEYFWSLKFFLTISFFFIQNLNIFLSACSRLLWRAFLNNSFLTLLLLLQFSCFFLLLSWILLSKRELRKNEEIGANPMTVFQIWVFELRTRKKWNIELNKAPKHTNQTNKTPNQLEKPQPPVMTTIKNSSILNSLIFKMLWQQWTASELAGSLQ